METRQREVARRSAILPILVVYLAVRAYWIASESGGHALDAEWAQAVLQVMLWVVPCVGITMTLDRLPLRAALDDLGLAQKFWTGSAFGIVATAPLGAMVLIGVVQWPDIPTLAAGAALGPFAESVLFAGFLFTQLIRRARWNLFSALAVSAVAFGLAHDQGLGGTVALSAGGVLFTWIYYRWNSLWPAIALHGAINFWWIVSSEKRLLASFIGPSVTPLAAAHAASIVLAIVGTVYWTRRHAPYGLTRIV